MKRKLSANDRDERRARARIGEERELNNNNDVSNEHCPDDMAALLSLLACPLCAQQVESPVTLLCGHTLCAHHVEQDGQLRLAPCPVPTCTVLSSDSASPEIPSTSRVKYIPAPLPSPDAAPAPAPFASIGRRTDITASKIAAIVRRHATEDTVSPYSSGDSTDAETDGDGPLPTSVERPKKRRRRQQPSEELRASLDKELTTELICEICLLLLYKPLTTPCQHVGLTLSALVFML